MSDIISELKVELMKYFDDIQFEVDIECQSVLEKRRRREAEDESEVLVSVTNKKEKEENSAFLRSYQHFIASIKIIYERSMAKLSGFLDQVEKGGGDVDAGLEMAQLVQMTRAKVWRKAGCESIVYVKYGDLKKRFQTKEMLRPGVFVHSPQWLNQNQVNFILNQLHEENMKELILGKDLLEVIIACAHTLLDEKNKFRFNANFYTLRHTTPESFRSFEFIYLTFFYIAGIEDNCFLDMERLKILYLSCNELKQLKTNQFQGLCSLISLSLKGSQIERMDPDCLADLDMLEGLYMNNNVFKELRPEHFRGLRSVRILSLIDCQTQRIHDDCFAHLTSLKELYLNDNPLIRLTPQMFRGIAPSLKCLDIRNAHVEQIESNTFAHLQALQRLDLDNNRMENAIDQFEHTFKGLAALIKLSLAGSRIRNIHEQAFADLVGLEELDLSRNNIDALDFELFTRLAKLAHLYIDKDQVCTVNGNVVTQSEFKSQLDKFHGREIKVACKE